MKRYVEMRPAQGGVSLATMLTRALVFALCLAAAGCGADSSGVWRAEAGEAYTYVYLAGDGETAIAVRATEANGAFDLDPVGDGLSMGDGKRVLAPVSEAGQAIPFEVEKGALSVLEGELAEADFERMPAYRHRSLADKMVYALYRERHGFSNEGVKAWVR